MILVFFAVELLPAGMLASVARDGISTSLITLSPVLRLPLPEAQAKLGLVMTVNAERKGGGNTEKGR